MGVTVGEGGDGEVERLEILHFLTVERGWEWKEVGGGEVRVFSFDRLVAGVAEIEGGVG